MSKWDTHTDPKQSTLLVTHAAHTHMTQIIHILLEEQKVQSVYREYWNHPVSSRMLILKLFLNGTTAASKWGQTELNTQTPQIDLITVDLLGLNLPKLANPGNHLQVFLSLRHSLTPV